MLVWVYGVRFDGVCLKLQCLGRHLLKASVFRFYDLGCGAFGVTLR